MAVHVDASLPIYPLSLERYERMVDEGILTHDDKVELIEGVLVEMSPEGEEHSHAIDWLTMHFAGALAAAGEYVVRIQHPVRFAREDSAPEPDLAIVARAKTRRERHPEEAVLVIEVAVSSTRFDLIRKARLYARAGIPEYWVLDIPGGRVVVHRAAVGDSYTDVTEHGAGAELVPQGFEVPAVAVAELLAYPDA